MRTSSTLFFMLISISFFAQRDTILNKKNKILIKWTPTAMIGYPSLQFAGELYYRSNKSIQLEYGLIIPNINNYSMGRTNLNGHKIRLEQRNYIGKTERFYLAPELHFMSVNYDVIERFGQNWQIDSITGSRYMSDFYIDKIEIKKYVFSSNLKIGYQYVFKNSKLVVDVYLGIGLRYVVTKFTSYPTIGERVRLKDYVLLRDYFSDIYDDDSESNRFAPNGILGIKIGYRIR